VQPVRVERGAQIVVDDEDAARGGYAAMQESHEGAVDPALGSVLDDADPGAEDRGAECFRIRAEGGVDDRVDAAQLDRDALARTDRFRSGVTGYYRLFVTTTCVEALAPFPNAVSVMQ
jgi:hypothetical protein